MNIIDEEFMICVDCAMYVANDDLSALSLLDDDEAAKIESAIYAGIDNLREENQSISIGESENDNTFSTRPCECCKSPLHGYRHHAYLLQHETG